MAGARLPQRGHLDVEGDITQRGLGIPYVCTSGTRPSSPAKGTTIFETDTGDLLMYYGATSGWMKPWKLGWGLVAEATSTTDVTVSTAVVTILTTASVALYSNRRYLVSYVGHLLSFGASSSMTVQLGFWRGTAAGVYTIPPQLLNTTDDQSVGGSFPFSPATTATSTWTLRALNSLVNGCTFKNSTGTGALTIVDVGPNGTKPTD